MKAGNRATHADKQAGIEADKPVKDDSNPQHKSMRSDSFRSDEKIKKYKKDYDRYCKERTDRFGASGVCNAELIELDKVVTKKHKDIKRANPIYCWPSAGCLIDRGTPVAGYIDEHEVDGVLVPGCHAILEDSELDAEGVLVPEGLTVEGLITAWMGKAPCTAITIDGESINDYRGLVYHCKTGDNWGKRTIVALGEFPGKTEIADGDLTVEQRGEIDLQVETERLDGLSDDDRLAEYDRLAGALLEKCALDKTKLELGGMTAAAALSKAKADYGAELVLLKTKYGVPA